MKNFLPLFCLLLLALACEFPAGRVRLEPGMLIERSVAIRPGKYRIAGNSDLEHPVLRIRGDNITIDFQGVELIGATDSQMPDQFSGLAVRVEQGRNITLKNLRIRGYRVAVMAEEVDSLQILDADLSDNYRQRLFSDRRYEHPVDRLDWKQNAGDEWLRYGAAVYLKNCNRATVSGLQVSRGQNGLLLSGCNDGHFTDNVIRFNSGVGIGLFRSSGNRILRNRLDWNVRGFRQDLYRHGQGSAGLLCRESCRENVIAFNSLTHCGSGLLLQGDSTGTGIGSVSAGRNIIYQNDFSYAAASGVDLQSSQADILAGNKFHGCALGLKGENLSETRLLGNVFPRAELAVSLLNCSGLNFIGNRFLECDTGLQLGNPSVASQIQAAELSANEFRDTDRPLLLSSASVVVMENIFVGFDRLLSADSAPQSIRFSENTINQTIGWGDAISFQRENTITASQPPALPSLKSLFYSEELQLANRQLPEGNSPPAGYSNIIMEEWGPYDFSAPKVVLHQREADWYTFLLLGPSGRWELSEQEGLEWTGPLRGELPAAPSARRLSDTSRIRLQFLFTPANSEEASSPLPFGFYEEIPTAKWWIRFYEYDNSSRPWALAEKDFRNWKNRKAGFEQEVDSIAFFWPESPGGGIDADRFATFAEATTVLPSGTYRLVLSSDDGSRLYIDGRKVIDHWDHTGPVGKVIERPLGGSHRFEVEHYERGGEGRLQLLIERIYPSISQSND